MRVASCVMSSILWCRAAVGGLETRGVEMERRCVDMFGRAIGR